MKKYKAIKNFKGVQGMILRGQEVLEPTKAQIDSKLVEEVKKEKKPKKDK